MYKMMKKLEIKSLFIGYFWNFKSDTFFGIPKPKVTQPQVALHSIRALVSILMKPKLRKLAKYQALIVYTNIQRLFHKSTRH